MIHSLMRVNNKVIQISLYYTFEIMECKGHSPLKRCFDVFIAEGSFLVCKGSPRIDECYLMLIIRFNLNLIITKKSSINEKILLPAHSQYDQ